MNQPRGVGATAVFVAAARALETARDDHLVDDPWAGEFVRRSGWQPPTEELDSGSLEELTTWVAARTKFLDDYVLDAVASGCGQVVLLGAGLDTRAFRLQWPVPVTVYELDTADMVAFKSEVLGGAAPAAATRAVVPIDLREDWPTALRDAGFVSDVPTAWILEGLLMYLPEEAVDALMNRVGELSAPGSAIGATITNVDVAAAISDAPLFRDGPINREEWLAMLHSNGPADPVAWFDSYGWRATVASIDELAERYGRTLPERSSLWQVRPGRRWLVSAVRK
ncbi:SAM-dependent methyltransferase [Prescottella agglutinans]|uniref:S-adenosyl-L-methionine-dependent methyltransferase n=1 Tax=Prescottella agglutinans TaxID=1644129 RepID=A0ABT6M5W6_9NOCA|nr:SAM-dependent methyltransferase [Prescottella agglutinans]MDH6279702.1 methyltransferase (TIGR00027 family) [Prescottella agglutinans]